MNARLYLSITLVTVFSKLDTGVSVAQGK